MKIEEIPPALFRKFLRQRLDLWAQYSGIKVDGNEFTFKNHNYLYPLFADRSEDIVLMKAAQMGATVFMLVKSYHMGLFPESWGFHGAIKIGFYFPEHRGVSRMVKDRAIPMMYTCDDLLPYAKEQRQDIRPVGDSSLYFLYMGGTSTKDSVPLNVLFFDEVRLVNLDDIMQAHHRVLHSHPRRYKHHVSTAGYPQDDIHALFLKSDQKWWHVKCESCGHYQCMPQAFPDCIAEHTHGPKAGQCYYICLKCKSKINDVQKGGFIAAKPGHPVSGYQISQLNSRLITPYEILNQYRDATDKKEFYNSILGIPFVNKESKPVTEDMLDNNVRPLLRWGEATSQTFMGIDQMMGLNYAIILEKVGAEKRVVWFEIVDEDDPWTRMYELMQEFKVSVCVCDAVPNSNEAAKFARAFERKVFLAYYGNYKDPVRWEEGSRIGKGFRRAEKSTYNRYKVYLDVYRTMDYTLQLLATQQIVWPDPDQHFIVCTPFKGGRKDAYPIMKSHGYPMFACAVREHKLIDKNSKATKHMWNFVGMDPHALHTLNYAVYASERKRTASFFGGDFI